MTCISSNYAIDSKPYDGEHGCEYMTFKKTASVMMRPAIPGEKIVTIMKNGHVETTNVAKEDQVVIKNPSGELYVINGNTFNKKYDIPENPEIDQDGFMKATAKGGPVYGVRTPEAVEFDAPWGEKMKILPDGIIVNAGENDIYGIQFNEFCETYKPCDATGHVYSHAELAKVSETYADAVYSEDPVKMKAALPEESHVAKILNSEQLRPQEPSLGL